MRKGIVNEPTPAVRGSKRSPRWCSAETRSFVRAQIKIMQVHHRRKFFANAASRMQRVMRFNRSETSWPVRANRPARHSALGAFGATGAYVGSVLQQK